jgi:5'-nucleotidase
MLRILVTNDDGYRSDGIRVLAEALKAVGAVTIVAPVDEKSAIGHALTLRHPLRLESVSDHIYCVDGTPTDCVLIAAHGLLDQKIDLVVSGVNRGPNMGDDVFYSGTVAAAIEGAMQGVPGVAVSLAASGRADFLYACQFTRRLVGMVLERGLPAKSVLNVNVPQLRDDEIKGVRLTRLGKRTYQDSLIERTDPRGRAYYWIGGDAPIWEPEEGTDFLAVDQGYVSVTPLHLDLTDNSLLSTLAEWRLKP